MSRKHPQAEKTLMTATGLAFGVCLLMWLFTGAWYQWIIFFIGYAVNSWTADAASRNWQKR